MLKLYKPIQNCRERSGIHLKSRVTCIYEVLDSISSTENNMLLFYACGIWRNWNSESTRLFLLVVYKDVTWSLILPPSDYLWGNTRTLNSCSVNKEGTLVASYFVPQGESLVWYTRKTVLISWWANLSYFLPWSCIAIAIILSDLFSNPKVLAFINCLRKPGKNFHLRRQADLIVSFLEWHCWV